ncbi:MAG TPA: ATP-dependent Clp protease ATP-binding subunit ClpA [Candidatus Ozemobacteraceae bacterium]|nr:ATP-dependent Clp protease ATP-binding subunit ClpA [Candidatus Ozemobacteraceae bacterium]
MINKELQLAIEAAIRDAARGHHEYVTVEHLLYAVVHDDYGRDVLHSCGGDLGRIKRKVEEYFDKQVPRFPQNSQDQPQITVGFQRVMQRAFLHVQSAGKSEANAGDVLAAIFLEDDCQARHILESEDITRLDVLNFVSHGVVKEGFPLGEDGKNALEGEQIGGDEDDDEGEQTDFPGGEARPKPVRDPLKQFATNLLERAAAGEIDPLVGRIRELRRTIQILARRKRNNVVFVGEPGVGKTALVEGLALKIHQREVPEILLDTPIYALDMGGMLAGTKYRGEFEARLKATIKALSEKPKVILFIDEIHTIVGAGATSGGVMDASNLLKPLLNSGKIRCLGATTYEEYRQVFEKDRALARRFQKMELQEPTVRETVKILKGLRRYYEEFHQVRFPCATLRAAAELSAKYVNERFLPDKAIDMIDEAGARLKLSPQYPKKKTVTVRDVERVVSLMARIPAKTVSSNEVEKLGQLDQSLKQVVFGQDEAINQLVSSIKRTWAGLGSPDRPLGSFLFIGPTGVGKTEVCKQMAAVMGVKFLRFDMSEYMEKHAVSRLIGAPPGYVGFDQGGLLTDGVRKNPYCVVLMDEIEKAHQDVFNILLQVMDYATLTDNNGKKADFRHVILVMTSNAGAQEMEKQSIGFGEQKLESSDKAREAVNRLFSPEFRNRLDGIISFRRLARETMVQIVGKNLREVERQLERKEIVLEVSEAARHWLAEHGYDPRQGARPLARLVQKELKDPLSEQILFGALKQGGKALVDLRDGKIAFTFESKAA